MAIQIRRGTNAGWEASKSNIVVGEPAVTTDTERAFIGTGSGQYMELANLERIAPAYDSSVEYATGDIVSWQGELYMALAPTSGAFNVSYWDKMTFAEILENFNEHKYDGYEVNTIENVDIASFNDGAGGIAVKDLQVGIEATQDLHGYSHPWAGGAGKNLADFIGHANTSYAGLTITAQSDGGIKISGTPTVTYAYVTSKFSCSIASGKTITLSRTASKEYRMYITLTYSDNTTDNFIVLENATSATMTLAKNVSQIQLFLAGLSTSTNYNETIYAMVEVGSYATTFEPYSNICPITGWTGANVYVTGKNMLKTTATSKTQNNVTFTINADGSITVSTNGTASALTTLTLSSTCFLKKGTYIVNGCPSGGSSSTYELSLGLSGVINKTNDYGSGATFTAPSDVTLGYVQIVVRSGQSVNKTFYPMIRRSTDSSSYEQYKGQVYTSSLGSTRYGGVLDVTTGVLTITHKAVTFDGSSDEGWVTQATAVSGKYRLYANTLELVGLKRPAENFHVFSAISNMYEATTANQSYLAQKNGISAQNNLDKLFVYDSRYITNNAEPFKTFLASNPLTVVYELATPQTVQLTPQEVETVYKNNNVWADSGDIKVLVYRMTRH